ncbi:uncharacterized protein LOC116160983 [Photinus pyralis]|uniref:uncharacterized protein LOC116160983 n=2 Tax=Photinus pyralis TaxID=7054 RepID=UPI0012677D5C|nr:uncharacterized protein LOC116160983 [Photinus pyralis]
MAATIQVVACASASLLIMSVLVEEEKTKRKRKHKVWVPRFLKSRDAKQLLIDLRQDDGSGLFNNFCRMSPEDFDALASLVDERVRKKDTNYRSSIPVEVRLAITLRFLATGDSYRSLMYLFGVSRQLISRIIPEVCGAVIEALDDYVKMPQTQEEWFQVATEFEEQWNFPHAIGAIDGKHVLMQCPAASGSDYYNYKSFFSIVLFAMVDANYKFMFADVGCQGRISDGGVFKNTKLYEDLCNGELNLPPPKTLSNDKTQLPFVILGDEAFALSENLMKPYSGFYEKGSKERIFNYRLSRARRVVENAFGICSSVFRVLRKPLLLTAERAQLVVIACIYLHNFLRNSNTSKQLYCPENWLDTEVNGQMIFGKWRSDSEMTSLAPLRKVPRRPSRHAQEIRNEFSRFFSTTGSVP